MAKASPETSQPETPTFEAAMDRLDGLVATMEADKLPLDELLVRYEEGIKLVKFCSEKLTAAEQRIEVVTRDAEGHARLAPLTPDEADEPPPEETGVSLF